MNHMQNILSRLPDPLRNPLESLPSEIHENLEEIRISLTGPMMIRVCGREIAVDSAGGKTVTREMMDIILNNLLNYSVYAYEDELAKGYITIEGGHRVGVCGRVVKEQGKVTLIKDISSLNIRKSREIPGIADNLVEKLTDSALGLQNTVIVSPPKCGKTTLLRDIVRVISNQGMRIAICDERSEIAGMYRGQPAYDLGPRTDVLDGCMKAEGMIMLIRSMSPDVLVTDEIGRPEDIDAISMAVSSGVKIITTIHGKDYGDLKRSLLGPLIESGVFKRVVLMTNIPHTGHISEVIYV